MITKTRHDDIFAITQGGLDVTPNGLRDQCLDMMLKRDKHLPGYAIVSSK